MLLWQGVEFNIYSSNEKKCIRCALLCIACDLPEGRKTCGFLTYNAHQGVHVAVNVFLVVLDQWISLPLIERTGKYEMV